MRWHVLVGVAALLLPLSWTAAARGEQTGPGPLAKPGTGAHVWDTGEPSAGTLDLSAPGTQKAWTAVATGTLADAFRGDAVLSNGRIVAVLRKEAPILEVHSVTTGGAPARVRLRLLAAGCDPAAHLERVALTENTKGSACLEATFKTVKGAEIGGRFRIKRGEAFVQADPGRGADKLRVECPGRFAVLPDFFADDITLDATRLPLSAVELPSENFLLHLTAGGDAIAMCVFENRRQDVTATLDGVGERRVVTGSEIAFEGKKVWVALLEAPRTWHVRDVAPADAGKVLDLDWKMPFPAQWRVDFTRADDLTDSWEMLLQEKKGGEYIKPSWLGGGVDHIGQDRRRWNTVLGDFPYPCWSGPDGHGYLQPLSRKVLHLQGPAIIYPINRTRATPLDVYTVMDGMRNTLGVGPCEHILDIEGQRAEYKGRATCSVRDTLIPIYEKKQQKEQRARVDRTLDEGLTFVKHIRGRITRYVAFGEKMQQYLAEQKKQRPELAEFIAEMEKLTGEIDRRVAARFAKIKTPEDVARMNEEFRKQVLDDYGPDALQRCKRYAFALVEIGDNQDELAGECRWAVKTLRQHAGIRMALDPRVAPVALEVRARTQEALRNPANHEGARH
jgi:hypothetical protein